MEIIGDINKMELEISQNTAKPTDLCAQGRLISAWLRIHAVWSVFTWHTIGSLGKAPDKQRICIFTQFKQHEYAIKLIGVRTKRQTKFVGTQCKSVTSVYATTAVSNCKQLLDTYFSEKTDKI